MPSADLSPIEIPHPTRLEEVRTSKLRPFGPVLSGIDKQLQSGAVQVSFLGLTDDEHDLTFHGGIDKAVHQYCTNHYSFWQSLFPDESTKFRFAPGGFGENLVASGLDETNVCIGDLVRIGYKNSGEADRSGGCLLEVSLPRQPCFKLNQRFGLKNFAPKTHQESKTGWYYRVKEEGHIEAGMQVWVEQRNYPRWSIARLHHYVHRDKTDMDVVQELINISVMGDECRNVFVRRWAEHQTATDASLKMSWRPARIVSKKMETPRIVRVEICALEKSESATDVPPGSHAVIKLPNDMQRAYSVVGGDTDSFVLGVALDDNSRGGSSYIHDQLEVGHTISLGQIARGLAPNGMGSHYIFIIGGIGITAFLAMMQRMQSFNMSFEAHYAVRNAEEVAFRSLLSALGSKVTIYNKSLGSCMDIESILRNRVWNSQVFTCGPRRMIDAVITAASTVGMTEDEVHYESFTADTSGDPFSVEVITKDKTVDVDVSSGQTLLTALRDAGFDVGSSCETGVCGTCKVAVKCGRVDHRGTGLTKDEQEREMLSCVSRGIGHISIELSDD